MRRIENVYWKGTEPLDVLYKVPVGCTPAKRASQEIPDKRILQEEKTEESMRQLSGWLDWAFEQPSRLNIQKQVDGIKGPSQRQLSLA